MGRCYNLQDKLQEYIIIEKKITFCYKMLKNKNVLEDLDSKF